MHLILFTCAGRTCAVASRHAPAEANGVEDQGSSSNKNARSGHVLTQLIHVTTKFQTGDIHLYRMDPVPLIMLLIAPDTRSSSWQG
jgi:hypothetical protein